MIQKLFLIDFLKYRRSRAFLGISILYIVIIAFPILSTLTTGQIGKEMLDSSVNSPEFYNNIWQTIGYLFKFMSFMLALIVITHQTADYQNNSFRQHIIDGMTRWEYYLSKLIVLVTISAGAALFSYLIVSLAAGFHGASVFKMFASGIPFLLGYFVSTLGLLSMALFAGLIIKNTGLAIALYLAYMLVELVLTLTLSANLMPVGGFATNQGKVLGLNAFDIDLLFPKGAFLGLLPSPYWLQRAINGGNDISKNDYVFRWIMALIYLGVFQLVNLRIITRKEI
ncbi:MAG: hypothetical protein SGJ04_08465 [Bacteroidota bacterium]|nr:hypothetical protein [Bacteroidota bacterium]